MRMNLPGFAGFGLIHLPPVAPMNETVEFLTDVVETHDGSEDRTIIRSVARSSFSHSIPTKVHNWQSAFNLGDQNLRGDWGVPLWADAQFVGTVPAGTVIPCDTQYSKFRPDDAVLIVDAKREFAVSRVLSVSGSSISVFPSVPAMRNAFIVPVTPGIVTGDITRRMAGHGSEYGVNYELTDPSDYPTHIAPLFALDVSGSMDNVVAGTAITRLALAKQNIVSALTSLRGAVENSNVIVDLAICFWSSVVNTFVRLAATVQDIDDAIAAVNAQNVTGGTTPLLAFEYANDFFGTISPNPGSRKDIMFFITDAGASNTAAAAEAYNMIHRLAPYDGANSVDIYAINIEVASIVEALKVDNASNGNIVVVGPANIDGMEIRFLEALEAHIGRQFNGYEVLFADPVSETAISGFAHKIEDRTDFETGVFSVRSPWTYTRNGFNYSFFIDGKEGALAFRQMLYRRFGKRGAFMVPSFQDNFNIASIDSGGTVAFVSQDDYDSYREGRTNIAIQFADGTWQFCEITDVSTSLDGGRRLEISPAIAKPLNQIAQSCYLILSRFDTDRIEISWIGDRCGEATINIMGLQ